MSILTATVTKVPFGKSLVIDGLLLADGNFAIAVPQLQELNFVPPNRSLKQLETLLGIRFSSHQKVRTSLNSKAVNSISLEDFRALIVASANKGNESSITMRDNLVGLSLTQLFSDAFNIKFEKEDRQAFLVQRETHKTAFHPLYTSWLQKDGVTTTYGTEVNKLKLAVGLPLIFCGDYDYAQLSKLNRAESAYDCLRKAGLNHQRALEILDI